MTGGFPVRTEEIFFARFRRFMYSNTNYYHPHEKFIDINWDSLQQNNERNNAVI